MLLFRSATRRLLLLALLCYSGSCAAVNMIADRDTLQEYKFFTASRDVMAIDHYAARRDVVELILLQQILQLGGYSEAVQIIPEQSYSRILKMVGVGLGVIYSSPVWIEDVYLQTDKYFISEAMVRRGEFIVGLYTLPSNKRALAAKSLADIRQLRALSNSQWRVDWRTLRGLGFNALYDSILWPHIVRMLSAGRADFTLAPFQSSEDLGFSSDGVRLVPIPNMRIALDSSRHWAVSRVHPSGAEVFEALGRGMQIMRQRQQIERAYRESGFFDPRVQSWPILNPDGILLDSSAR